MHFSTTLFFASFAVASPAKILSSRNEIARRQATEACATGYCLENGGTTGGASGETVTVSDLASLQEAAESEGALTIIVSGSITGNTKIRVESDKTIFGESGSCELSPTSSIPSMLTL